MKLSVEISTYNRKEVLRLVLEGLARQTYPSDQFEVVVSDDGSTDGTPEMIQRMRETVPYALRLVGNKHQGCGHTHNAGILAAAGHIVLMLADDILPVPRLLEEHMRDHAEHSDSSVAIVGRLKQSENLPQTIFQKGWDRVIKGLFPVNGKEMDYTNFWVSNLSFKKDFMIRHGMFLDLPAGSHEDLELGHRLQRSGMRLMFNPLAVGFHHHAETIQSVSSRSYVHGYNWHFLEERVPDLPVRIRSGNVVLADGVGVSLQCFLRQLVRTIFLNRVTIQSMVVPLIEKSESVKWVAFSVPFLSKKVASYHFRRGLKDYRRKASHRLRRGPQGVNVVKP